MNTNIDEQCYEMVLQLKIALADAIRRPMGVIPESAAGLVTDAELQDAESRRVNGST